jgi:cobalt-zinc-cadmium efflux system protein
VIGDSVASVGVIAGGFIMLYTEWYLADPIIATVISIFLFWIAKNIIKAALHILLEAVPEGISVQEVKQTLKSIPDIKDIHELHIWSICSNIYALSAHALVNDQKVNQVESILDEVKGTLKDKFNITHSTIQFETNLCGNAEVLCEMKH